MAISWSQGLLAGAAGVAEYSEQEQARRQKRLDRTNELKNSMRMHQAKSKYAITMNEYASNRQQLKTLESVEPGSFAEQIALGEAIGLDTQANTARARGVAEGKLKPLARPGTMKVPEFVMPSIEQGQARSPISDWVDAYKGKEEVSPREQIQEAAVSEVVTEPEGPLGPPASEFGEAVPLGSNGTEINLDVATGSGEATEFETFTGAPAPQEKVSTVWRDSVVDGKRVIIPLQSTPSGATQAGEAIPLGDDVPEDAKVKTFTEGGITEVYVQDSESGKLELIQTLDTPGGDRGAKSQTAIRSSTTEINSFMAKQGLLGTSQYQTTFSAVDNHFTGSFVDDAEKKVLPRRISKDYLNSRSNLEAGLTPEELLEKGHEIELQSQGVAVMRNLKATDIADILMEEDPDDIEDSFDINIFRGPHAARLSEVIRLVSKSKRTQHKAIAKTLKKFRAEQLQ